MDISRKRSQIKLEEPLKIRQGSRVTNRQIIVSNSIVQDARDVSGCILTIIIAQLSIGNVLRVIKWRLLQNYAEIISKIKDREKVENVNSSIEEELLKLE